MLQLTAIHCINTATILQQYCNNNATQVETLERYLIDEYHIIAAIDSTLQHAATHCNTQQYAATILQQYCNTGGDA